MDKGKAKRIGHWLLRAWPVWAMTGLGGLNFSLFRLIRYDRASIHGALGPVFQIVGGAFVLYFLNKNMGVFNRGTLSQRVVAWIKSCPIRTKHYVLHAEGGAIQIQGGGNATLQVSRSGGTVQEQLDALRRQIEQYHEEMKDGERRLRADLRSTGDQLRSEISARGNGIAEVRSLLATTVVGSVNPQLFGILLVLYGTVLPLIK